MALCEGRKRELGKREGVLKERRLEQVNQLLMEFTKQRHRKVCSQRKRGKKEKEKVYEKTEEGDQIRLHRGSTETAI